MDEITAPKDRAVAVAGGAGLVAAGVDEGVQTAEEVVGKDEILHKGSFQSGVSGQNRHFHGWESGFTADKSKVGHVVTKVHE